jgi:hypothetical protein
VAAAQAARAGWAEIIADWQLEDEPVPAGVLAAVVEAVHAVGGRVAVHSQHAAGEQRRSPLEWIPSSTACAWIRKFCRRWPSRVSP